MRLWRHFLYWLRRHRLDPELTGEMESHRAMLEDELRRAGASPEEARFAAARRFGNPTSLRDASRDQWGFAWLDSVIQDLRFAFRSLSRSKSYTATAVLTLGAGLGLNTVLFTLFNAYVLTPLAVREPGSLYQLYTRSKSGISNRFTWAEFRSLKERRELFDDVLAVDLAIVTYGERQAIGTVVSGNYFASLGVEPLLGRVIRDDDAAAPGRQPVIVLSHRFWKAAFGLDPAVVGSKILLRGQPFEIIGVMGPAFSGLSDMPPDFWAPVTMARMLQAGADVFSPEQPARIELIGRLHPGVAPKQAESALEAFVKPSAERGRFDVAAARAVLKSRATQAPYSKELMLAFSPIIAALVLVLITCCANVSNMMLARATSRQRELGVRMSLGAGRMRLVRQLLTESLLVALLAGAVALGLAHLIIDGAMRLIYATMPSHFAFYLRVEPLTVDHRVLLFVFAAVACVTVLFGLAPSLQASRTEFTSALRGEFSARLKASRLRDALVIAQVTVCAVLLSCALTLFRRAATFQSHDPGLDIANVLCVQLDPPTALPTLARQLAAERSVEAVSVSASAPFFGRLRRLIARLPESNLTIGVSYNLVSPGYLNLFHVPVKAGRGFTELEAAARAPLAIISESTARTLWPDRNPMGQTIGIEGAAPGFDTLPGVSAAQVIGIVRDVTQGPIFEGHQVLSVYLPMSPTSPQARVLLVRAKPGEMQAANEAIKARLAEYPQASARVDPLAQVQALQIYPFRVAAWIGNCLAMLAALLTISGMYGVMSYLVGQRTREIGIRLALGATPASMLRYTLAHAVKLTSIGVVLGGALAYGAAALVAAHVELDRIIGRDHWTPLLAVAFSCAAAISAAVFPARRASSVDPAATLRSE